MKWQWLLAGFVGLIVVSVLGGVAFHFIEAEHEERVAKQTYNDIGDFLGQLPSNNAT